MRAVCESCGANTGAGEPHKATVPCPSIDEIDGMMLDGDCEATDGCTVDPDGKCEHGHRSWLLVYGLI